MREKAINLNELSEKAAAFDRLAKIACGSANVNPKDAEAVISTRLNEWEKTMESIRCLRSILYRLTEVAKQWI